MLINKFVFIYLLVKFKILFVKIFKPDFPNQNMFQLIKIYLLILVTGDEIMLLLSSIRYEGFFILLAVSVLANLTADLFIFSFSDLLNKKINLRRFKSFYTYERKIKSFLNKTKNPEKIIFISKMVYGTRIASIILLGRYKMISLKKFLFYNFLALLMIDFIVLFIGWNFGYIAASYVDNIFIYLGIIIILLLLFKKWTEKKLAQLFLPTKKKRG